ncbi:MAG: SIS domain-containing protein [Candidatus Humimicrobiaceae bacterium]
MNKAGYTFNEIINQTETLELVYEDVLKDTFDFSFLEGPYDEIIFFGCGTDYNLCQSASFFTRSLLNNCNCCALPPSELLINPGTYLKNNKKYLIIGFSRSGETTESIEVVERLKKKINVTLYMFSAVKNSKIIDLTKNHFICRGAVEKSVAMTKAYTSFLFAYCVILTRFLGRKDILLEFEHLIKYLKSNMDILFDKIDNYIRNIEFNTFFALGSGFNYGIAVEADLKMKEMSRTQAYSYYLHEFNHGPKTMVNDESLILILNLNKDLFRIEKVLEDIISLGSKVLIVSGDDLTNIKNENVHFLLEDPDFKFDLVRSFINIPVFQMLAYIQASKKNLNPDRPRNLNFTTRI